MAAKNITQCKVAPRRLAVLLGLYSSFTWSQDCNPAITATAPAKVFTLYKNGTALDTRSGLLWQRCSLGQRWDQDNKRCLGQALHQSWHKASNAAAAQLVGWRLPSVNELSALVESKCQSPAIDQTVFPDTPIDHFWTATPFVGQADYHWLVQFQFGENHVDKDSRGALLRLVKDLGSLKP
ncbi:MAG: DUF1566 domain-containing protein [Gammaproteobacteria bacterium]|nr:DUF1566 domain-containing protein [Gammaproteobacteria bacterium]MDH5800571.1 DUF1566 domain-containing protein [Gammaproteobacteria bacterium]